MLADIVSGKTDLADLCFLVAVILAVVAAAVVYSGHRLGVPLIAVALAAVALGLLAL